MRETLQQNMMLFSKSPLRSRTERIERQQAFILASASISTVLLTIPQVVVASFSCFYLVYINIPHLAERLVR